MSRAAQKVKREDSFSLSMVDLFGCGFIAAIFLFILNLVQPQIEAAVGVAASSGSAGRSGTGLSGPVFVSVRSEVPVRFSTWPVRGAAPGPAPLLGTGGGGDHRFKYSYDQLLPDAATLKWPLHLDLCATTSTNSEDCGEPETQNGRLDLVVRVVVGYSTSTAYLIRHPVREPINLAFEFGRTLRVRTKRVYEHRVDLDMRPDPRSSTGFHALGSFHSPDPLRAAAGWISGVAKVSATGRARDRMTHETPSAVTPCWAFADSVQPGGGLRLVCPSDQERLVEAVGNGSWRSEVFAQFASECSFPFNGNAC